MKSERICPYCGKHNAKSGRGRITLFGKSGYWHDKCVKAAQKKERKQTPPSEGAQMRAALELVDKWMSGTDAYEGGWSNYPDKPEESPASVVRALIAPASGRRA